MALSNNAIPNIKDILIAVEPGMPKAVNAMIKVPSRIPHPPNVIGMVDASTANITVNAPSVIVSSAPNGATCVNSTQIADACINIAIINTTKTFL